MVEDHGIRLVVPVGLRDAFGVGGEKAVEVARLINAARRAEVKEELRF